MTGFARVNNVSVWWQMVNFVFLCPKRWFQFNSRIVRTHFSSIMSLNNWKMIAETQSHIFRWRSRFRRRRVCLSSLMKHWMRLKPNYGNTGVTDTNLVPGSLFFRSSSLSPRERKKRVPGNEIRQTIFKTELHKITVYNHLWKQRGKTLHLLIPCHADFIRRTFVFSQFKPTGATRQLTDRFLSMPVFDQVFNLQSISFTPFLCGNC